MHKLSCYLAAAFGIYYAAFKFTCSTMELLVVDVLFVIFLFSANSTSLQAI